MEKCVLELTNNEFKLPKAFTDQEYHRSNQKDSVCVDF